MSNRFMSLVSMKVKLIYGFLIFSLPIFSYAHPGDAIELPEWWGNLSLEKIDSSECPDLDGYYSAKGELYELLDGNATSASQNGQNTSYAGTHLPINKKPINKVDYQEPIVSFAIKQDLNSLNITKPSWQSARVEESYLLSLNKKDYSCDHGWLILPATSETIGHESSHSNFKESIRYSKLNDGALVGYITQVIKSSSIWTLGYGETHERVLFIKFPKQTRSD